MALSIPVSSVFVHLLILCKGNRNIVLEKSNSGSPNLESPLSTDDVSFHYSTPAHRCSNTSLKKNLTLRSALL